MYQGGKTAAEEKNRISSGTSGESSACRPRDQGGRGISSSTTGVPNTLDERKKTSGKRDHERKRESNDDDAMKKLERPTNLRETCDHGEGSQEKHRTAELGLALEFGPVASVSR